MSTRMIPEGFEALCEKARAVLNPRRLSDSAEADGVGPALLADDGHVYTASAPTPAPRWAFAPSTLPRARWYSRGQPGSPHGRCALDGSVIPPCGRCREFISQLHADKLEAEVMVTGDRVVTLCELLPYH